MTRVSIATPSRVAGVMVFSWGSLRRQMDKVDEMAEYYRKIRE